MTTSRIQAHALLAAAIKNAGIQAAVFDRPVAANEAPSPHVAVILNDDTPTDMNFTVYVVSLASIPSVSSAYRNHLELVDAVDSALGKAGYGPSAGNIAADQSLDAYVYTFNIEFPRDYF